MEIRPAIPTDIEQIAHLLYQLNQLHQANLPNDFKSPEEIAKNIPLSDYIDNPLKIALVVCLSTDNINADKIVGFMLGDIWERKSWILKERKVATIMDMAIDSDFQGQGIGKLLYQAFESHMKRFKAEEIMVEIYDFNKPAIAFYQNCGIEPYIQVGIKKI